MKKYVSILAIAILVPFLGGAQDLADALRYSNFQVQGTARSGGMGNAFGALGGDFTSVSINPAGLGVYRSGELALTPTFGQTSVETSYLGTSMSDEKFKFSFNNISYVTAIPTSNRSESGIISINVGIGYNRLKDFNSNAIAVGHNAQSSILDNFASNANQGNWSDYYEELASNTDLLLKDENTGVYWHDIEEGGYGQSQQKSITRQGSIDEYTLGVGLNFNHKLYLGASVGITDIYYKENSTLIEWDDNNDIDYFNELQFDSKLRTTGNGYNVKLGIIFKPTNQIRLGASVHTPTFYNLHDVFDTKMSSSITYDDGSTVPYSAIPDYLQEYDYDLETPLRATLSAAFVVAKKGLLSIDYEYVDYGSASLRRGGDGYDYVAENQEITEAYRAVGNLRLGGEYRLTNAFSLRAGYELYPSAYNDEAFGASQPNADSKLNIYSAGLGYRNGGFYFDMAYRYYDMLAYDMLYPAPVTSNYADPAMAEFNTVKNRLLFTFGFKF
ncbi:OmpP1/FadL family transporter [Maribellus maritimus]|uniref:OmpP1/FadL family transporter n=1 Tax=Maribellus maritimus TaxID=2870838 RepID=UPI001EEBA8A7|nr:outer membrane protein transport protein [Maribellus maritimus]MCG6189297.1 outer membrane protein transport protein [Maribellus maritimus]